MRLVLRLSHGGYAWLGDLFLNALKMLIVPLVVAAVVSGIASVGEVRKLGRSGGATVLYFLVTTATAMIIGLAMVNLIEPGVEMAPHIGAIPDNVRAKVDTGPATPCYLVSPNLIDAAAIMRLLLIVFAILLSAALTTLGEKGAHVIAFFDGLNEA